MDDRTPVVVGVGLTASASNREDGNIRDLVTETVLACMADTGLQDLQAVQHGLTSYESDVSSQYFGVSPLKNLCGPLRLLCGSLRPRFFEKLQSDHFNRQMTLGAILHDHTAFYAAMIRAHMQRYDATKEQFAHVVVRNRRNA